MSIKHSIASQRTILKIHVRGAKEMHSDINACRRSWIVCAQGRSGSGNLPGRPVQRLLAGATVSRPWGAARGIPPCHCWLAWPSACAISATQRAGLGMTRRRTSLRAPGRTCRWIPMGYLCWCDETCGGCIVKIRASNLATNKILGPRNGLVCMLCTLFCLQVCVHYQIT